MAYFRCGGGGTDTSADTVTAATLLSGYTAHDKDGNAISGGMTNRGAVAPAKLNCGGSYTIPAGYHNGSGKVEVNTLASHLSGDTVAAEYLLSGYKAHTSAGTAITGSMVNKGATNAGLAINGTYTIPAGYHNGAGKVTQSISTKAATTHYASTSSKTLVSSGYYCSGNQNLGAVTATNLSAGNVKSGVTISVSNGSANLYSVKGSFVGIGQLTTQTKTIDFTANTYSNYKSVTFTFPTQLVGIQQITVSRVSGSDAGYYVCGSGQSHNALIDGQTVYMAMSTNQINDSTVRATIVAVGY